jgi:hypothetical protein
MMGCEKHQSDGIILGDKSASPIVQNGWAYDKATLQIDAKYVLVVPHDARINHQGSGELAEIYMEKSLQFAGHPPEPMSIRLARHNMGCAFQVQNDRLVIATYGEWDSNIEGGAKLSLLIKIPESIRVETRPGLSGTRSIAHEWDGEYIAKPSEVKEGYWYGPAAPRSGWTPIATVPDSEMTIRSLK